MGSDVEGMALVGDTGRLVDLGPDLTEAMLAGSSGSTRSLCSS